MFRMTRILAMSGMGLVAGMAIGAGPAQAADTAGAPAAKAATGTQSQAQQRRDRDRIVGYYRSARACHFAGRLGERFNKWDDYDCDFVRFGFRRGSWALEVEQDRWGRPGHGHDRWDRDRHDRHDRDRDRGGDRDRDRDRDRDGDRDRDRGGNRDWDDDRRGR